MGIKISELNEALEADNEDLIPVVDVDENSTKKISVLNLSKKNGVPTGGIMGYDGDTIPSGYEEVDGPNHYSTTEQVIGTWIDGKPIYRQVITTAMPQVNSDGTYPTNISLLITSDVDEVTFEFFKLIMTVNDIKQSYSLPYISNSGRVAKAFLENSSQYGFKIVTATNGTAFSGATVVATIEYTKTTD